MNTVAKSIATVFGLGRFPLAPGTVASLVALPFGWGLGFLGARVLVVGAIAIAVMGIMACDAYAKMVKEKDPGECVIDEVAGQWIALVPVVLANALYDWRPIVMAFFLFRLFDITKPFPARNAEKLVGGLGIVADDIVAGLYAALVLYGMMAIQLI